MTPMTPPTCCQTIEWLGAVLRIPADWEVTRHSLNPLKGALTFVDRRRQRLQFRWTQCRKEPLLERMFDDHRSAQLKEDPDAQLDDFQRREWVGLSRPMDDGLTLTRAARFDTSTSVLQEATFTHEDGDPALRDELLDSIRVQSKPFYATRLRAFGLEAQYPPQFRATSAKVQVGKIEISCQQYKAPGSDRERPGRIILRKLGMADGWFRGDLQRLLSTENPKARFAFNERVLSPSFTGESRATALTARSIEPGPRLKRYTGFLRTRRDLLWHSPPSNAIYHIQTRSFDRHAIEPSDIVFRPSTEEAPR